MANEQNLIPQAHKLTVEEQSKGGKARAQKRKEQKAIQDILNEYLKQPANKNANIAKLAEKAGLKKSDSIKDVFAVACLLNTLKKGTLDDLEKLSKLLGETEQTININTGNNMQTLADLINAPMPNRNISDFEDNADE